MESVLAPKAVAVNVVELLHGCHAFLGGVWHGCKCGGGGDYALVVGRRRRRIALGNVAGGESPALRGVSVALGVGGAICVIYAGVGNILLPIIRVSVFETARVKAQERIVGEEHGASQVAAQRERYVVELASVLYAAVTRPALVVGACRHRMGGRCRREHIADQSLVPAAYLHIHHPVAVGRPVPVEDVLSAAGIPVPLHIAPYGVYAAADVFLFRTVEVTGGRQQALDKESGLYQVSAVVVGAEGDYGA